MNKKNKFLKRFYHLIVPAFVLVAGLAFAGSAYAEGDAELGAKVFKKCKTCHMVGDGAKSRQGPMLNDIIDRAAGVIEGFRYSKALQAKAAEGLIWTEDNLSEYLKAPRKFIPRGKMAFVGLKKPADIENVIAYLNTFE